MIYYKESKNAFYYLYKIYMMMMKKLLPKVFQKLNGYFEKVEKLTCI